MFWDFINQVYRLPMLIFKRVLSNPMGTFIYSILSKWYALVMISVVVTTFWVFKGLEKAGVLEKIEQQIISGFSQVKSVAQHCTPLILNLQDTWNCVQNPPEYAPPEEYKAAEEALAQGADQDVATNVNAASSGSWDHNTKNTIVNPYDQDATTSAAPADAVP